jgi:hypothetical protein
VFGKRSSAIGYQATTSIMPGTEGYGWKDHGHVFHTVTSDKYNAIDADVVRDTEGNYWMAFGSFGLGIQLIKAGRAIGLPGKRRQDGLQHCAAYEQGERGCRRRPKPD